MDEKTTTKADFASSIVIILFSIVILVVSFRMPAYEKWGLYATPSLTPIAFAFLLLLCGLILFVRSAVKGGYRISVTRQKIKQVSKAKATVHFTVVLGLVILYYLLLGRLHFAIISAGYIFFNILYFKSTAVWKNLLISGIAATSIWYLFNNILYIPLP
ncbi:MAG: tripartite tricarboxylate transporter TctB family protein [Spirochaetaceae bacterium]